MRKSAVVLLMLIAMVATVWADPIEELDDPAVLHIGTGHGTACAHGCGGHPNEIGSALLSIYVNPNWGGADLNGTVLSNPLVLLLGVPVFGGGPAPAAPVITSVTFYDEDLGAGTPVTFANLLVPPAGLLIPPDGQLNPGDQNAYVESGYNNVTNKSNKWVNWSAVVPGVSYFALFAYRLNKNMDGHDLLDVTFGSGTPFIAIAYGCEGPAEDAFNGSCDGGKNNTYSTPFTEAGFTVPEPSSLLLLGTALLALGRLGRKKKLLD